MKKALPVIIATSVLAAILIVFSFGTLDYDLSRALINRNSLFGEFFNMFGELPANLGMALAVFLLYAGRKREGLAGNIGKNIAALPFMLLFLFMAFWSPFRYVYEFDPSGAPPWTMAAALAISLAVLAFALWFGNRKGDREKFRSLKSAALFMLVFVVAEILVVNLIKPLWARPRMRSIETADQFRKWYQIQGWANSEELKSFPSGHTANGFTMIMYTLLIGSDRKKAIRYFTIFAIVWGVLVALSRVILGAHFLTDVTAGGYITLLLFFLLKPLFIRKQA